MAATPQTWKMLQALQYRIFTEVLDPNTGLSPFDPWSSSSDPGDLSGQSDLTRYGTNPFGTVSTAIYVGYPKDPKPKYNPMSIIVPVDEHAYRRALGGKIWIDQPIYFCCFYKYVADWYSTVQQAVNIADVAHGVIAKHAEMPNAPTVIAVKEEMNAAGMQTGFFFDAVLGRDWYCWATVWWHRQEYTISGGIVP